jgi:outer membrane protein OmpA-like peptidoglycan-associated protein
MKTPFVLAPSLLIALAVPLAGLAGCASTEPPPELVNARVAYSRIQSGPTAQNNHAGVMSAWHALDSAEREFKEHPSSDAVKTQGYVAQRTAEIAEVDGRTIAARNKQQQAEMTLVQMQAAQARQEAAMHEQQANMSERRAKIALDKLGLAAKDEPRGTVVTLPGASMFATNKAEIMPAAEGRLAKIADAVKQVVSEGRPSDVGRRIMLIGYTDSTGNDQHNMVLSKKRAESVKMFFTQRGLNADMLDVDGKGEADPIASNDTKEGRAENRRVEIVITPPTGSATPETTPNEPR